MVFLDQLQREVVLKEHPQRIVSLVPSQTELLVYLGLEEQLVGVTKFCVHPPHLRKEKTVVGGTKKVNFDKISRLRPEVILCNKEENTEEMVLELEKIAPVHVSEIYDLQDVLILHEMYGELFDCSDKTTQLNKDLLQKKREFEMAVSPEPRKVAYFIWRRPWMVAGGDTFIDCILELNGWENVFKNRDSRYPEIDLEELQMVQPDLVLLSSEPFPFKKKHVEEIKKYWKTPVELVDGEYFSWYGSRLLPALDYFTTLQRQLSSPL